MRQEYTRNMLNHWLELFWESGNEPGSVDQPQWPERSDIEPARCRELLGNMFILERRNEEIRYRLAGTTLCSLFGRELKQEAFASAFGDADLRSAENWVDRLGFEDHLVLLCTVAETLKGETVDLETLLLPLLNNGAKGNRIVGITVPCSQPYWLGADPIKSQTIKSARLLKPWEDKETRFGVRHSITDPVPVLSRRAVMDAPSLSTFGKDSNQFIQNVPLSGSDNPRRVAHLTVIDGGLN